MKYLLNLHMVLNVSGFVFLFISNLRSSYLLNISIHFHLNSPSTNTMGIF